MWGRFYWPLWMIAVLFSFSIPELYALFTRSENTYSAWVWNELGVTKNPPPISEWSAAHALIFGMWIVLIIWATYHLFFRRWT